MPRRNRRIENEGVNPDNLISLALNLANDWYMRHQTEDGNTRAEAFRRATYRARNVSRSLAEAKRRAYRQIFIETGAE